jgi:hypothetical protein
LATFKKILYHKRIWDHAFGMNQKNQTPATTKLLYDLEILNCDYGDSSPYIPPGRATQLVRKMNQGKGACDTAIVKHENGALALQWGRFPENLLPDECRELTRCELPLTRQEAFALLIATTTPDAFLCATEFQPEIDALWG